MDNANDIQTQRRVLLIGGASGTGKTSVSYRLADHFGVGITEIDDIQIAVASMTTPEQQPILHYWRTHPEASEWSAERILELHLSVAQVLSPAFEGVVANHLEDGPSLVLEGDYLLPALAAQLEFGDIAAEGRVRAAFLYEPDEAQIRRNFQAREPEAGEQTKRARVSWLYGQWLKAEAEKHHQPTLAARPWETLLDRVLEAVE